MDCRKFQRWLERAEQPDPEERARALEHAEGCPECRRLFEEIQAAAEEPEQPQELADRQAELERLVSVSLDRSWAGRRLLPLWLIRLLSMLAGATAVILVFMLMPDNYSARAELARTLVGDHLRHNFRLDLDHPAELERWLAVNADFAARMPQEQIERDRGPLVGATVCEIDSMDVVHLVFRYRVGLMSLYLIDPDEAPPGIDPEAYRLQVNNYRVTIWKEGKLLYATVK